MTRIAFRRVPFLALAAACLAAALWAGLLRLGAAIPLVSPRLPPMHGPLMVTGFFGALIALERAVAVGAAWAYLAPLFAAGGMLAALAGVPEPAGPVWAALGSGVLLLVQGRLLARDRSLGNAVIAAGTAAWCAGNALLALGWPPLAVAPWWMAFLVLTIAGERIELNRVVPIPAAARVLFVVAAAAILAGAAVGARDLATGVRVQGAGALGLALWLLRYDMARRGLRAPGLPRFLAVALLSGYAWLGVGGLLALRDGGEVAGALHDARLHAVFVGFVFSMVFAHAPLVFPAVLEVPVPFRARFWGPLAVLHASLAARVAGDLLGMPGLRQAGGIGNALAIVLFLAGTASAVRSGTARSTD